MNSHFAELDTLNGYLTRHEEQRFTAMGIGPRPSKQRPALDEHDRQQVLIFEEAIATKQLELTPIQQEHFRRRINALFGRATQRTKTMSVDGIVMMGTMCNGKSTLGKHVANELGLPFVEGDNYHSQANRDKMDTNVPLTCEDRLPWLHCLHTVIGAAHTPVVMSCSALKQSYRDVLRADKKLAFVYPQISETEAESRAHWRSQNEEHFMKKGMVASQFAALEEPTTEETDVITLDGTGPLEDVQQRISNAVHKLIVLPHND